jgi:nucleoside-diphosphate-sugar epimerase
VKVAVTGASGFVGGRVVATLRERGHDVTAFGRRATSALRRPLTVPYVAWDITRGPLTPAPEGDAVIHCAGSVSDWGPEALFHEVNAGGTQAVLDTFRATPRFVHVSTASVYDPFAQKHRVREDAPYAQRYLNAYARSKVEAERRVRASGRPAVILRPHAIYGPDDPTLLPRLLASRRCGWLPAIGDGTNLLSVTHVDNLVAAAVASVEGPVGDGIFNIADVEEASLETILRTLLGRLGLPQRIAWIPRGIAWPLGSLAERVFLAARSSRPPLLTRYLVAQLAAEYTLDLSRARELLGYRPRWTFRDGPLA